MKQARRFALALVLTLTLGACAPGKQPANEEGAARSPAGVVDSVFPMAVMLDLFRADIEERSVLAGLEDRDDLVERMVRALESADTMVLEDLAVNLSEWAWLYFPTSTQAQPPYELPPGMAWLQIQQNNRTGVLRALERFGAQPLDYRGYTCDPEPRAEGENHVWVGCLVTVGRSGEAPAPIRLFSSILERNGRFAILSYANDF